MVGMLCFMGVLAAVALTLCRLEDNKSRRIFIDYQVIKVQQFNAMRSAAQREDFLRNQKRHQEDLINQIFPKKIAKQLISKIAKKSSVTSPGRTFTWEEFKFLKSAGENAAEMHKNVTICFTDIVGFTKMSNNCKPIDIMRFLDELFLSFDMIIDELPSLWKVETIGDSFMVAGGLGKRFVCASFSLLPAILLERKPTFHSNSVLSLFLLVWKSYQCWTNR